MAGADEPVSNEIVDRAIATRSTDLPNLGRDGGIGVGVDLGLTPSLCARAADHGERLLDEPGDLLLARAVPAVVLDVLRAADLGAVQRDGDPAVVLPRCLGRVVLELDVDAALEQPLDDRGDPGCVVVPAPSVHVGRELEHNAWRAVGGDVERRVDVLGSVGAHGVGGGGVVVVYVGGS